MLFIQLISLLEAFLLSKEKKKEEEKKGEKDRMRKPLDYNSAFIKIFTEVKSMLMTNINHLEFISNTVQVLYFLNCKRG